jgi:hypothetical protein
MKKYYVNFPLLQILLSIFLLFFSTIYKNKVIKPNVEFNPQDSALNFQPTLIRFTSFGNDRLISSFLWTHSMLFSDTIHFDNTTPGFSWLYYRFNNISELEPYFYENYHLGGMYLSVIKDDRVGAENLLLKGISKFNSDASLNFYLGMLYMFDIKNYVKALIYFKAAYKLKHPYKTLPSMIVKLERNNNSISEDSYILPYEAYKNEKSERFKFRYYEIAYKAKAEFDLKCLQSKGDKCSTKDLDGNLYLLINGLWVTPRKSDVNLDIKSKSPR